MTKYLIPPEFLDKPFRLTDAVAAGLSRKVLSGSRFRRVFRGVYASAELADTTLLRIAAARIILPADAVFSHLTAAELCGLPVPEDQTVHVTLPPDAPRPRIGGIHAHQARLGDQVRRLQGWAVTTPARTFLDLAGHLGLVDLVIVGDAMVRKSYTRPDTLRAVCHKSTRRGAVLARQAADLIRPRVDSPMETRLRLLIVLAGLPCPVPGFDIIDPPGWIATADLAYPQYRIDIEYDSYLHMQRRKWRHDIAARDYLRRHLGWEIIPVTSDNIYQRPLQTLQRIREALTERGCPDLPDTFAPAWQTHFASRPGDSWSDEWTAE